MRKTLAYVMAVWLTLGVGPAVYASGAEFPGNGPVELDKASPKLNDLISQENRVHGFWVNHQNNFFFAGDTAAFQSFLDQYASVDGIAGHLLTIHKGKGRAKSPWDKGKGKPCDWKLDADFFAWTKILHADTVFMDPEVAADIATGVATEPTYMAELHVWTGGHVDLDKVKISKKVYVVREEQDKAKAKGTADKHVGNGKK